MSCPHRSRMGGCARADTDRHRAPGRARAPARAHPPRLRAGRPDGGGLHRARPRLHGRRRARRPPRRRALRDDRHRRPPRPRPPAQGRRLVRRGPEARAAAHLARRRAACPTCGTTAYDGHDPVPTLDDILALRARLSAELGRVVGVYLELKHPARFARLGLPLGPPLLASLEAAGLNTPDAPVIVESFESLRELRGDLRVPIGQLVEPGAEVPVAEIAEYAQAVGAHKDLVIPRDAARPPHRPDRAGGRGARAGPARALLDVPRRGAVPPDGPRRRGRAHGVLRGRGGRRVRRSARTPPWPRGGRG